MKDELGGRIMTEFAILRPKTNGYLTDDNDENKKSKTHKKNVSSNKNINWEIINIV